MQNAQQIDYLRIIVLSFLLTHVTAINLHTEPVTKDQHAFRLTSNAHLLNMFIGIDQIDYSNAMYMTSKGLWVDGCAVSQQALHRAADGGVIKKKKIITDFADYDFYEICISPPQQKICSCQT